MASLESIVDVSRAEHAVGNVSRDPRESKPVKRLMRGLTGARVVCLFVMYV